MEDKDLASALQEAFKKLANSTSSKGGKDGEKRIIPLLSQIERNTRLLGSRSPAESGAAASRGKGSSGQGASSPAAHKKTAKATATAVQKANAASSKVDSKALTQAVEKGAAAGVASAMSQAVAAQQRLAEKTVKATSAAQAKANNDFLQRQKKLATGPKSAAALKERRATPQGPQGAGKSNWLKQLIAATGRGAMQAGGMVKKGDGVKDLAGELTVGGPILGALKEVAEVASEAGESLQNLRKKTDKTTKATDAKGKTKEKKGPASRGRNGRYEARKEQREERRQNALLQAVKRIRPGGGGGGAAADGGGGLLSSVDDAMDIWGHAKDSKWGKRAKGAIGKGARFGKGLIGKGLGLVGLGGAGVAGAAGLAGATGVASGVAGAGAGGAAAAGVGGKLAGKLGARAIPVIGQALAVGMAAYDGIQGWTDKELHAKSFGTKAGEEATTGQKAAAATANVLDMGGLTSMALGLVGVETDASKFARGIYDSLNDLTKSVDKNSKTEKENTSWLAQLVSPDSWLGKMLGLKSKKPKDSETPKPASPSVMTGTDVAKAAYPDAPKGSDSMLPINKGAALAESFGRQSNPMLSRQDGSIPPGLPASNGKALQAGNNAALSAISEASAKTGTDSLSLAKIAYAESGLKAGEQAKTSSAGGLFQFTDSTWNATVAKHGAKHGLAPGANKFDPKANAAMGAELYKETKGDLSKRLGREASETDTYMGHFLGTAGASKFIKGMEANPDAPAASLVSADAAKANQSIFSDKTGRQRSAKEVHDLMGNKLNKSEVALNKMGAVSNTGQAVAPAASVAPGSDALDSTTLNMPVKTAQGIKTPAQMGIKTNSELQSKGGQAFAGGKNDPATTFLTAQIMKDTKATSLNAQNDTYHQQNAKTSGHTQGIKTDFSYAGLSDAQYKQKHAEISSNLANKYGMKEGEDFNMISDPHGTGKHIDFKLNPSGQKKAEAARQATLAKEQGAKPQDAQAADAATAAKPAETAPQAQGQGQKPFYDPNSKLSVNQQASLAVIQKNIDKDKAAGNDAKAAQSQALLDAKKKDYGVTDQPKPAETPAPAQATGEAKPNFYKPGNGSVQTQARDASVQKRIDEARAGGNEAQAQKWEAVAKKNGQVVQERPKAPENAADIKAKTPPPPTPDNKGVEQRLDAMSKQQALGQQTAERDTESQNTPNIPFEFDDYTLQSWAHDRA